MRLLYISDVRETEVGPGSRLASFSKCLWPTLACAFLAPDLWPLMAAGRVPAASGRPWLARLESITVPCCDAGTLATKQDSNGGERPRHGSAVSGPLGPRCFISASRWRRSTQRTDDQRAEGCGLAASADGQPVSTVLLATAKGRLKQRPPSSQKGTAVGRGRTSEQAELEGRR